MDNEIIKFREFDLLITNLCTAIPLKSIEDLEFNEKNSISYFSDIIRSKNPLGELPYSDFKIYDEILFISRDIKYYVSLLYFFKPYIVDSSIDGKYFQNLEDKRYMMYTSICYQSFYIFWDRIGDLLNLYFKTGLDKDLVYFPRVLNNFPIEFRNSENFVWLYDTYNLEIKDFLGQRNLVVHSYQLECEYYWKVIEHNPDLEKIKIIQAEKESYPALFKHQISLTHKGFAKALQLINELPNKIM